MIRAALFALVAATACTPAHAQQIHVDEEGPCLGRVLVTNQQTGITDQNTLHDVNGVTVNVLYHSTPNYNPFGDPRDIVTVTVPDGFAAVPSDFLLDEGTTVAVLICEAVVG